MRRWPLVGAGALLVALAAGQVLIPRIGERRVESRLTAGGGSAQVTLSAFPAVRLLFSDGDRLEVKAHDLVVDMDQPDQPRVVELDGDAPVAAGEPDGGPPSGTVFVQLDGFTTVDISIANSTAGPFTLGSFTLDRDGEGPYRIICDAMASPTALARYGLDRYALPGEGVIDVLLSPLLDALVDPVPVNFDLELVSEDAGIRVVSGRGRVAGLPADRLAELIASAIVADL